MTQQKFPAKNSTFFTELRWNIKDNFCLVISIRTPLFLNKIFFTHRIWNQVCYFLIDYLKKINPMTYFKTSLQVLPKKRSENEWASLTLATMEWNPLWSKNLIFRFFFDCEQKLTRSKKWLQPQWTFILAEHTLFLNPPIDGVFELHMIIKCLQS